MFRRIRKHASPASLIAMVALFVSLGGISYAAATIHGSSLVDKSVAGKKLKNKTVTGGKVKANSLTGAQIKESTLGKVPTAATADEATSAASATTAVNAQSAATAANATAISDDTVSSAKVQDGSLTGHDVGRRAGTKTYDFESVAVGCEVFAISVDPGEADMRDDAFAVTFEQQWPTGLVFSTENSDAAGYLRLNICNLTGAPVALDTQTFHWVAFDV